jgi:hypothetical protein
VPYSVGGPPRELKADFFVTNRVIAAAEELTLDYNIVNAGRDLPCRCGAEKWRGMINLKGTQIDLKEGL